MDLHDQKEKKRLILKNFDKFYQNIWAEPFRD